MKNLLVVLCFIAVAIAGWMLGRPNPLLGEIATLERELKAAREETARLKTELAKRPTIAPVVATAASRPTAPTTGVAAAGGAEKSGGSALRKMMELPGMKEMMKQQNLVQIDMLYGRLFEKFQLTPEEKENLKQLLGARSVAQTELGLKLMGASLTSEQRRQATTDFEAAKKASDESIRTFLGDEGDYKTFQHWEDTLPERTQFEMMGGRTHFSSTGEALVPEQEQQIIDLMARVRKAPSQLPDLSQPENFSPGNLSDEQIARQLQKYDRDAATVAQQAAAFLSPAQLQGLANFQQQMRGMAELGLKMSSSMLRDQK